MLYDPMSEMWDDEILDTYFYEHRRSTMVTSDNISNKIKVKKDKKIFGISLFDQETLNEIQERSGMDKSYTTEWQFHYWSLVGKLQAADEALYISVPLSFFNYTQYATVGSVNWEVEDVNNASNQNKEIALKKAEEVIKTIGKDLTEKFGISEWNIVAKNNIHIHPNGVNNFSGIDKDINPKNPGIVFIYEKIDEGEEAPYFSSIIQYKTLDYQLNVPQIVHSEFKVFEGDITKKATYREGHGIMYVHVPPTQQGPISKLFFNEQKKKDFSYYTKDQLSKNDGNEMIAEIAKIMKNTTYRPDVSAIRAENIKKSHGKFNRTKTTKYNQKQLYYTTPKKTTKKNSVQNKKKSNINTKLYSLVEWNNLKYFDKKNFFVINLNKSWNEINTLSEEDLDEMYLDFIVGLNTKKK